MATTVPETVRTGLLYDALDFRVEHVTPVPLESGHVAIAPKFCGLCGTDLHMYFTKEMTAYLKTPHALTGVSLPAPFGHEFAGIVTEIAENCSGRLKVGDKVAVMPMLVDGSCPSCLDGSTNTCPKLAFLGVQATSGGMSERAVVPEELLYKLPEDVECDVGGESNFILLFIQFSQRFIALVEPLAVASHGVKLVEDLSKSTSVFIIGAGPVGCATLLCLKAKGVTNIAFSEPSAEKRQLVLKLGARTAYDPFNSDLASEVQRASRGDGVDVVFECAGVPNAIDTAVACVRPKGTIVQLALPLAPVMLFAMLMKEVVLKPSIAYTKEDFADVIKAVEDGSLKPEAMITKRIKLEEVVREGLEALKRKDNTNCKILVDLSL